MRSVVVPKKQAKHIKMNPEIYDNRRIQSDKDHRVFVMYHHTHEDILVEKNHGKMSMQYL
jgi:hypothetical protein